MRLGNGRWETAKFSNRLQVEELGLGSSSVNAGLWKVNYTYGEFDDDWNLDANKNTGNIAKQTLTIPGATFVQNYRYDWLYRLKDAVEPGTGSTANWTQTFDYDRYGNRTAFTQTVGGVTTHNSTPAIDPAKNRFVEAGTNFDYDLNGNLIRDGEGRQFTFNGDNKQTVVRDAANNIVGHYFFDGEGKRVKKITNSETTIFVYSSGKLVAEYSTQLSQNPTISYTTTDHLGSPRIITDTTGNVKSRRDFMPFGEDLQAIVGNRSANTEYTAGDQVSQKFTGYLKDTETGLDFAEARMYENRHGRFTAVDPLLASGKSANPQTFNRYVYVGNNPVIVTDPTGLDPWYKKQIFDKDGKPTGRYSYQEFAKPPGKGWEEVAFDSSGFTTVNNWCSGGMCYSAPAYLYAGGGQDFGERANYGLDNALADTGVGVAQWFHNNYVDFHNAFYYLLDKSSPFTNDNFTYLKYWESENQTQVNAGIAMTGISIYSGAFTRTPQPMRFAGFGFQAATPGTATVVPTSSLEFTNRVTGGGLKNVFRFGQSEPIKFVKIEGRSIILDGNHRTALNFALRKQFTIADEVRLPFGAFRNKADVLDSVIPKTQVTQSSAVRFFRRPGEK